jgi:lysozyme family protein
MNIEQALKLLLVHEGGFVDHPDDPGGATKYGITERTARRHGYKGHMRDLPWSLACEIYRLDYWAPIKADQLPDHLRFHVFDAAVNSGPGQAIKWLQQAAGFSTQQQDGIIGPRTLSAASMISPAKYSAIRLRFMTGLSTWATFGKGWARRIADNLEIEE